MVITMQTIDTQLINEVQDELNRVKTMKEISSGQFKLLLAVQNIVGTITEKEE